MLMINEEHATGECLEMYFPINRYCINVLLISSRSINYTANLRRRKCKSALWEETNIILQRGTNHSVRCGQ